MRSAPSYDNADLRRLDVAHHLPPQQDWALQESSGGSRIIVRGEGSTIWDAEGNEILDAMAGLWCTQIGYGRRELADIAHEQMVQLPFYNSFFRTAAPPTIALAARIADLLGGSLSHVFFNNSGSEAVDTLVRTARYYWQAKGEPQRSVIIGRKNGYHGSTIGGVSMGGMVSMHNQGGPWVPDHEHVMQPYSFEEQREDEDEDAFSARAAQAIENKLIEVGPERVAMIFGEPVQGAGGVIIPPRGYWKRVEEIARKYGVLLGCDEVICGYGRIGEWFGFQHFDIQPDLVSMAKGLSSGYLPISATAMADHVVETIRAAHAPFVHGYTYSGHPTAAAVALANIDIIEREGLVMRTKSDTGPYLAQALQTLSDHPLVGEVRSIGLLGAIEITSEKGTSQRFGAKPGLAGALIRDACIERGLMLRAVKDTLVMSPPLIITHEEIDRIMLIARDALDACEPALREAGVVSL
ncbi:aminotransferase [Altericroceibacterium endophyticum]|uniref:Aminotransferase class III-fold pyridoxal phosphate-dependent enzyme n=1 Tax=Altericroceibacterium endophyticum TaxID=1808508 RepID=A0A6I4T8T1_9SPHN|nr:aminotransferase [Altericroceibacterium endophyticum]MXO66682.1 aminotransferase class III-fold pyridoxal phosphate-dependent enzyme [Altericroceibacterium endophyticum]